MAHRPTRDHSPDPRGEGEQQPWTEADGELARIVWRKCSANAKKLFSILIDNEGRSYSGEELAALVDIPNGKHGDTGVLAWPGRHCFAVGRTWMWSWEYPGGDVSVYWLNPVVAGLFRAARDS